MALSNVNSGNPESLVIVDVFKNITDAMIVSLAPKSLTLNYSYGRSIQILTALQKMNNSTDQTIKNSKYPLFALFMPFDEVVGGDYYVSVKIPKIVIAVLSNNTDTPEARYQQTFNNVLYPVYEEFKRQLGRNKNIVLEHPDYIPHRKRDNPGSPPPKDSGGIVFGDYVDAIEIYDLQLTFQLPTG